MSLYYVQKLLYNLNRDPHARQRYKDDFADLLQDYELTEQEREALLGGDIGLLYVMGVNGQILMHYAALLGYPWDDYIGAMRNGLAEHGPVRAGFYTTTDGKGAV